jgi:hypothetical protein
MTWSAPPTAVYQQAPPYTWWNTYVRDNLNETAPGKATTAGSIFVGTAANAIAERIPNNTNTLVSETSTSTSYADIPAGTVGPSLTITSGPKILIIVSAALSNSTVNADTYMAPDVTGAFTQGAADNYALIHTSATANARHHGSLAIIYNVTAGSSTYLAKYKVSAGTGTFNARRIGAIPF